MQESLTGEAASNGHVAVEQLMRGFCALPDSTWASDQHLVNAAHDIHIAKSTDRTSGASRCDYNGAVVAPLGSTGGLANPAAVGGPGPMEKSMANSDAAQREIKSWSDDREDEQLG